MQYTIRGIPSAIDEAVRERAKAEGKSLNEVAVEALATNHLWIAALVLQHNLRLHDRDGHFDHLPQIVRV